MTPSTLTTILNSAPVVIQGATKLIKLIREQASSSEQEQGKENITIEDLNADIERLEERLAAIDESNIEQIKLIEQLARQNEMLAGSLAKLDRKLHWAALATAVASILALLAVALVLS